MQSYKEETTMERDKLMQKARANKCLSDSYNQDSKHGRKIALVGFLDFMHPELSEDVKAAMLRDVE